MSKSRDLGEFPAAALDIDASGNLDVAGTVTADGLVVDGAVGIGTSLPSRTLELKAAVPSIRLTDTNADDYGEILGVDGSLIIRSDEGNTAAGSNIRLEVDGSEKVRIDDAGNLLVGTTQTDVGYTDSGSGISLDSSGSIQAARSSVFPVMYLNKLDNDGEILQFRKDGTTAGSIGTENGNIRISTTSTGALQVGGSDYYRWDSTRIYPSSDSTQNLGLSTYKWKDLHLSGEAIVGGMYTNTLGTSNFRAGVNAGNSIIAGGNYNTIVGDAAGSSLTTGDNNLAVGFASQLNSTTAGANTTLGYYSGYAITTGTRNVAVGGNTLDSNTVGSKNVAVGVSALGANVDGSRSVAVGDSALASQDPASALDMYNTAVGHGAGSAVTTGINNTLIGGLAGDALTDADSNTAIGYNTLTSNTVASACTAVGSGALYFHNVTSAAQTFNTAVGYDAGNQVTTGTHNTLIGGLAGDAITTASSNTAVGSQALTTNTTGADNAALGRRSLNSNTTGSNNTGLGLQALYSNTTASNNTAVGGSALFANTTGDRNTAVGKDALISDTTGIRNTAIGYSAGALITTGDGNTILGERAGTTPNSLTTGSNNTLVGSISYIGTANSIGAIVLGHAVQGYSGYTTLGYGTSDIRTANGSISWATVSDERYKKNIQDCTAGLNFVNSLRSRTWDYKTLGELPETFSAYEANSTEVFKNTKTNHGFIAQEVKAAIDADSGIADGFKLWDEREDGSQEVAEAALIPVLTKAIQQLSAQVDALTARIETLEG